MIMPVEFIPLGLQFNGIFFYSAPLSTSSHLLGLSASKMCFRLQKDRVKKDAFKIAGPKKRIRQALSLTSPDDNF